MHIPALEDGAQDSPPNGVGHSGWRAVVFFASLRNLTGALLSGIRCAGGLLNVCMNINPALEPDYSHNYYAL